MCQSIAHQQMHCAGRHGLGPFQSKAMGGGVSGGRRSLGGEETGKAVQSVALASIHADDGAGARIATKLA